MTLTDKWQLDKVDVEESAVLCCQAAADLIERGQYEAAVEALGDLWRDIGEEPNLQGLTQATSAEVLLQVAVLSGWLASAQVSGSQDEAKDLLTKALRTFQLLDNRAKVAEVHFELSMCYWRTGAFDEARVVLQEALAGLEDTELTAKILIRLTLVEIWEGRYLEAWDILKKAQPLFEKCNDSIKGRWHGQLALVLRRLATAENRTDYADRAIIEFTAAIYHYEQAGHERHRARNLNNLAMLLYKLGRYREAHENLDRAHRIFSRLNDPGNIAQVNETRCQVLLAEQRYGEAAAIIDRVVETFEQSGEQALLADALTIKATIHARLEGNQSLGMFQRAIELAETVGAQISGGVAALSLMEELHERLSEAELFAAYERADKLLSHTQDAEHITRLRNCARIMVTNLKLAPGRSLPDAVLAHEARYIEQALLAENGRVSRAAGRLGVSHQALTNILNTRHKDLLSKRTPIVNRRKTAFRPWKVRAAGNRAQYRIRSTRPIAVLLIEDNELVRNLLLDILQSEGWRVDVCADGASALTKIQSNTHYDVVLTDNNLPGGVNGIELIQRVRELRRHRSPRVIMISASPYHTEALRAGADAFLMKPDQMDGIVEAITRLLKIDQANPSRDASNEVS